MAIVSLGTIKHAPKTVFEGEVSVIWPDSSLRFSSSGADKASLFMVRVIEL